MWDYKIENLYGSWDQVEAELKELGSQGWELIKLTDYKVAIFKRPIKT